MREYEATIIIQPQLEGEAREQVIERVLGWLTAEDGENNKEQPLIKHWGQRQLAYPIRKFTEGYYVFYEFKSDPGQIKELERNLQYTEDVLRYLVVRKA